MTTAKVVWDMIVALLHAGGAAVRLDATKAPAIWLELPPGSFSHAAMPVIVVERPDEGDLVELDNKRQRQELTVQFWFIVQGGASVELMRDAEERACLLRQKVRVYLSSIPNLHLAYLGVLGGFIDWKPGRRDDARIIANNCPLVGMALVVPVITYTGEA